MSPDAYTRPAIVLHWAVAIVILGAFPVGLYMVDMPLSPAKLKVYSYHKWAGVTVFLLALTRLVWRAARPAPALPAGMPAWERTLAGATHVLLYILLVAVPASGWLMSSALGFQTVYFGVLPIPDLLAKDKVLGEGLKALHLTLVWGLACLVALHAAAALKHHLIDRDGVLARMLPFLNRREERR